MMKLPVTVWGLALGMALLVTGNILLVSVTALVGVQLAPRPALITLPVALQFIGLMAATLPAAHLMRWLGRKVGFLLGNLVGVTGALVAYFALAAEHFGFFCVGTFLVGAAIGASQQYRFAAIEACVPEARPKAISLVMAGGVLAAILGPNLAVWSGHWWPGREFLGAFGALVGLYVLALFLIASLPLPKPTLEEQQGPSRSYRELLRQPMLVTAIIAGAIGYGVMVLVMTATPVAMHGHHHGFSDTASVIQWHVLGMFLPSFFTGRLIARFGETRIIYSGCVLLALCALVAQWDSGFWYYWFALVTLGVGWNFTFIGATSLLAQTYQPAEKAKVQGLNDFLVFGCAAFGSLMAGHLQSWLGWELLNLWMLPPIAIAIGMLWYANRVPEVVEGDRVL
ncbi:MFS transporter [Marinimicrobium alkaliphilum]|uniref:MFS transporter n=1 Tax=Marinimicrobium alkaliphilum TaxID=2202654 RepID=UPI0018E094ED|nr:MFS transporter [Marinimicrobium alkaliphilum]